LCVGGTEYVYLSTVHDSSAKLPSGVLNGNVNQYGDIDQCLNVRAPWLGGIIKGRYCLTTSVLTLSDPDHPLLGQVQQLLQSHSMLRSELDDVSNSLLTVSKAMKKFHMYSQFFSETQATGWTPGNRGSIPEIGKRCYLSSTAP
jgi:hypothetical protein